MTHDVEFDDSITEALRLDRICDRFESILKAGQFPPIEYFIGRSHDDDFRARLLEELVQLEVEYRFRHDQTDDIDSLVRRFPEQQKIIRGAIERQRLERATQQLLRQIPDQDTKLSEG